MLTHEIKSKPNYKIEKIRTELVIYSDFLLH